MELPNDLIKATNYSKAKEREIHEFEYVNGKYIHRYVLGGEHEMTPQEIVDCLNAIATIDCDLSTAYAYIKGQDEKIADLQHRLEVAEKALELACEELMGDLEFNGELDKHYNLQANIEYFKTKAREVLKSE